MAAAGLIGCQLLLFPAYKLRRSLKKEDAMSLFNRASYYPVALLVLVLFNTLF